MAAGAERLQQSYERLALQEVAYLPRLAALESALELKVGVKMSQTIQLRAAGRPVENAAALTQSWTGCGYLREQASPSCLDTPLSSRE